MKITLAGRLIYHFLPFRQKIIQDNIDLVFKDRLTPLEKIKLTQAYYSHFYTTVKEMFQLGLNLKKFNQRPVFIGEEHLKSAFEQNKGVLILCAHLGNFQLASCLSARYLSHLGKFNVILRPISIKLLEKIFYSGFDKFKVHKINSRQGIKKIYSILKKREAIFFAFDQHAKISNGDGIPVDFFGKNAGTYKSLAYICKLSGATVIPAYTYRDNKSNHHFHYLQPLEWISNENKDQEIYLNTVQYNQALEKMILENPEQWHWAHRRWKI